MKLILSLLVATTILLAGCFETTQDVTIKSDGSGSFSNTTDMSAVIAMLKQMGGKEEMDKMKESSVDTTISLATMADSLKDVTPEDKELFKKGSVKVNMDMANDKFITILNIPFNKPEQVMRLNKFAEDMVQKILMSQMAGEGKPEGMGEIPPMGSINDYYTTTYGKGVIEKKLNKEKYATVEQDEAMKGLKEIAGMGMPMNSTTIINLPSPAKKVAGKNVKLSDDKKKVTIVASPDEFFDDGTQLEFRVEY